MDSILKGMSEHIGPRIRARHGQAGRTATSPMNLSNTTPKRSETGAMSRAGPFGVTPTFCYAGGSRGTPSWSARELGLNYSAYPSGKPTHPATGSTLLQMWFPPGAPDGGFELSLESSRGSGSTRACARPLNNGWILRRPAR